MKKPFKTTLTVFVFFMLVVCAEAAEKNIYFDSSARSGGNGSIELPYDDLSDINWEIVQEWVSAGYTVSLNLKKGSKFSEEWDIRASGVSGRPITIQPYSTGNKPAISGSSNGIDGHKINYIDIDNISFTKQSNAGVRVINCETWNITNCDFTDGNGGDGIRIETDIGDGNSGPFLIQGCTFDDLDQGIYNTYETGAGSGEHIVGLTIDSCSFHDIRMAFQDYHGTDKSNFNACSAAGRMTHNFVVTNNTVDTTQNYAFNAACQGGTNRIAGNVCTNIGNGNSHSNALQIGASKNLTIENNIIDTVKSCGPGDGHGIILDHQPRGNIGADCIGVHVRRNIIRNASSTSSSSGIKVWDAVDCRIYYNIIYECKVGISISKTLSTGNEYYGNVIHGKIDKPCVQLWGDQNDPSKYPVPDTWWYNNIFYGGKYAIQVNSGGTIPTETNNLHYGNTWSNAFSKHSTSLNADPLFSNAKEHDYSLKAGSPAIDAGRDLGPIFAEGLHPDSNLSAATLPIVKIAQQNIYGNAWEMGAYVFIEGSSGLSDEIEPPQTLKILTTGK